MSDIDGNTSDMCQMLSDNGGRESDMADDASDSVKPWTVRGIPPEERNAASEAAKRAGMTLGEWLRRAIRTEIQQTMQASRAPVPVGQVVSDRMQRRSDRLAEAERIAASLSALAASGVAVPADHAALVTAALTAGLPKLRQKAPGKADQGA